MLAVKQILTYIVLHPDKILTVIALYFVVFFFLHSSSCYFMSKSNNRFTGRRVSVGATEKPNVPVYLK